MEAEYEKLKAIPSFKYKPETIGRSASESDDVNQKLRDQPATAAVISRQGSSEIGESCLPRYESLKDVMASVSPRAAASEIGIRNELVKHAASAYVLSATVIIPPDRDDGDSRIFERIKSWFLSCWQVHAGGRLPVDALCWPLFHFLHQLLCS